MPEKNKRVCKWCCEEFDRKPGESENDYLVKDFCCKSHGAKHSALHRKPGRSPKAFKEW